MQPELQKLSSRFWANLRRSRFFHRKIGSAGRANKDESLGFALPPASLFPAGRAEGAANPKFSPSDLPIFL
jgi:hypothetical protein